MISVHKNKYPIHKSNEYDKILADKIVFVKYSVFGSGKENIKSFDWSTIFLVDCDVLLARLDSYSCPINHVTRMSDPV